MWRESLDDDTRRVGRGKTLDRRRARLIPLILARRLQSNVASPRQMPCQMRELVLTSTTRCISVYVFV